MNREEAKGYLTNLKHWKFVPDNLADEALDMAIKALAQEPCDDAISRQAVDNAIYDYSRACDVNYAQIMEYIDKLPSVNPQEPTATLDKIRSEIEELVYPNGRSDYLLGFNFGLMRAAQVIDKYRVEGSEKE